MPKFSIQLKLKKAALKKKQRERVKQHLYNKSIDKIKPQIDKTKTNTTILTECTYIVSGEIFKRIMKIWERHRLLVVHMPHGQPIR